MLQATVDPKFDPPFLLIALLLSFCYLCSISQVKASKALLAFSVVSAVITQSVGVANSQRTEAPGAAQLTVTCTSHDRLTHRLELLNGTLYVTEVQSRFISFFRASATRPSPTSTPQLQHITTMPTQRQFGQELN
jgi:hypothetical protein